MRYKFLKYARTRNLPDHESERLEVSVELRDGDSPDEAFEKMSGFVKEKLDLMHKEESFSTLGDQLKSKGWNEVVGRKNGEQGL